MDGILNINKPGGKTSFSVVARIRRLTGEQRVGHAGTLDPAASGVLPVCFGQGTRIVEFLVDTVKTYRAEIELGVTTDTYDGEGRITRREDSSGVSRPLVESALDAFSGEIRQLPPMYSAVKYHGKPLYRLARAGITIERKTRPVQVFKLEIIDWQPPLVTVDIVCGKGTYIRSLAHDLGQKLGCGAYLRNLVRLRCGIFDINDAVSPEQLEEVALRGDWQSLVYPVDSVLQHMAEVKVSEEDRQNILHGRPVILSDFVAGGEVSGHPLPAVTGQSFSEARCRAYALDGRFLGVLRFNTERYHWQPEKVFH